MTTETMILLADDPVIQNHLMHVLVERCALTGDMIPGEIVAIDLDRLEMPARYTLEILKHIQATYN